jgi:hypothetical protein
MKVLSYIKPFRIHCVSHLDLSHNNQKFPTFLLTNCINYVEKLKIFTVLGIYFLIFDFPQSTL